MTQDVKLTKLDRMRYTKDSASSTMVILAIVLNVLYFVSLYQCDHITNKAEPSYFYYSWTIGASVIYNLLFLLFCFLASVGVKGRKSGYTGILSFLGVMQFVRIFYIPAIATGKTQIGSLFGLEQTFEPTYQVGETVHNVMTEGHYVFAVIMLIVSGVLCIAAAVTSYLNNRKLAAYMKTIEK